MPTIATGSSSFTLVNQAAEPLTGRMYRFDLYPLALQELAGDQGYSAIEPRLDFLLRFGDYPSIVDLSEHEARIELDELVSNYLYRDALLFVGMGKSTVLIKLLEFLARQIGQEISYQEIGQALGIDQRTVNQLIFSKLTPAAPWNASTAAITGDFCWRLDGVPCLLLVMCWLAKLQQIGKRAN